MGKKSHRKSGQKKPPPSKNTPSSKGKKFPSSAITPNQESVEKNLKTGITEQEEPLQSLVDEPLPKSFYWFLALMGGLFVAFLFTEPFYRQ